VDIIKYELTLLFTRDT